MLVSCPTFLHRSSHPNCSYCVNSRTRGSQKPKSLTCLNFCLSRPINLTRTCPTIFTHDDSGRTYQKDHFINESFFRSITVFKIFHVYYKNHWLFLSMIFSSDTTRPIRIKFCKNVLIFQKIWLLLLKIEHKGPMTDTK